MASNKGDSGDNVLKGKDFTDLLFGRGGNDKLFGNEGSDVLKGGRGSDILDGGSWADVFVFGKNDMFGGKNPKKGFVDTVKDFKPGVDKLLIEKGLNGIQDARDVLKASKDTSEGLEINLGNGNKIILKDVTKDMVSDKPYQFFNVEKFN